MVGLVLTQEEIRSAPAEVRDWLRQRVEASFTLPAHPAASESAAPGLAVCELREAAEILELIKGDYLTCQVFFELGREAHGVPGAPELRAVAIDEIMRHTRIADSAHLGACLEAINRAFQSLRRDPAASLFAFDRHGLCYIHVATHRSIEMLWRNFIAAQMQRVAAPPAETVVPRFTGAPDVTAAPPYAAPIAPSPIQAQP